MTLLSDLQSATAGSRELDARAALAVGWVHQPNVAHNFKWRDPEGFDRPNIPHYTTSLDSKLPGENIVQVHYDGDNWIAYHRGEDFGSFIGIGRTEALARRAACLKAREKD